MKSFDEFQQLDEAVRDAGYIIETVTMKTLDEAKAKIQKEATKDLTAPYDENTVAEALNVIGSEIDICRNNIKKKLKRLL